MNCRPLVLKIASSLVYGLLYQRNSHGFKQVLSRTQTCGAAQDTHLWVTALIFLANKLVCLELVCSCHSTKTSSFFSFVTMNGFLWFRPWNEKASSLNIDPPSFHLQENRTVVNDILLFARYVSYAKT